MVSMGLFLALMCLVLRASGLQRLHASSIARGAAAEQLPALFALRGSPSSIGDAYKQTLISGVGRFSILLSSAAAASTIFNSPSAAAAAEAASEDMFINAIAFVLEAKEIVRPVKNFIEGQNYDNARTNVAYIVNQLQLEKKMNLLVKSALEYADNVDEYIDSASETAQKLGNSVAQLDSTIYTIIFIPSEDGEVTPTQEKYRKQSYDFYAALNSDLDALLKLASDKQLAKATLVKDAEIAKMPKILFEKPKKKSGI